MSEHDIRDKLGNFETEQSRPQNWSLPLHANVAHQGNISKFYRAPVGTDCQNVVVEFIRRPSKFPQTRRLIDVFHMTDEDRRMSFRQAGKLVPRVDAHFHGLTPLSSPWFDKKALKEALEAKQGWLSYLFGAVEPSASQAVRVECATTCFLDTRLRLTFVPNSIITLTPPGQHPYNFWKSDAGDMWLADFLPNEGFDATRISVFGTTEHDSSDLQKASREFLDRVKKFKDKSKSVSSSLHSPST